MSEQDSISPEHDYSNGRVNTANLTSQAHSAITKMIRNRTLRGGDVIVELSLAKILGISRTPLREALQRLEGEGLVVKGTGRSYIVRRVHLVEYLQSLKVRELLEPEAAALSTGHIPASVLQAVRQEVEELRAAAVYNPDAHWQSDDNLHHLLIDYCSNAVMANILRSMRATTKLFEFQWLQDRLNPDVTEHLVILNALENNDSSEVRKAVSQHIASLLRFAVDTVR